MLFKHLETLSPVNDNWQLTYNNLITLVCSWVILGCWKMLLVKMRSAAHVIPGIRSHFNKHKSSNLIVKMFPEFKRV